MSDNAIPATTPEQAHVLEVDFVNHFGNRVIVFSCPATGTSVVGKEVVRGSKGRTWKSAVCPNCN